MENKPEKEITIDDIILATKHMDAAEYFNYMELPLEQRIEIAREILEETEGR